MLLLPLAGIALYNGLRAAVLAVVLLDGGLVVLISISTCRRTPPSSIVMGRHRGNRRLARRCPVEAHNRVVARYRDFANVSTTCSGMPTVTATCWKRADGWHGIRRLSGQNWREMLKNGPAPALDALLTAVNSLPFHNLEFELPDKAAVRAGSRSAVNPF